MKRLISGAAIAVMLITLVSGCAKKKEPEYNIEDYKNNGGLSGIIDQESIGQSGQTDTPSENKPSGGTQSPQTGNNQQQSNNKPQQTLPDDYEPEDIQDTGTQGAVDNTTTENGNDLPYKDKVSSSIGDMVITKDSYDESKLTLPCIRIDTFDSSGVVSKEEYNNGTISIDNTIKSFQKNKTAVEIRGRGNSTWTVFDKKAYKLRFGMKTSLMGMGEAKKWVLLANALDETMLRNSLAFDLASILEVEYTTGYRFVNLFLNGEYQGVYQLCEQLEEGENRININSSKSGELDTGYFIESYGAGDLLKYKTFTLPDVNGKHLRMNEPTHQFVVKSPGAKTATDEQVAYIKDYVSKVNTAIFTGDWKTFSETCDVDSFVNMFLVDQIMLNNDMGYSFYMYKEAGGKLHLGPAWDYDQSCGLSSHGGTTYKGWYAGSEHAWYSALLEMPEFRKLVKNRYNAKKKELTAVIDSIDKTIKSSDYDFAMSNFVYNNFGNKKRWRTMPEIYNMKTYKQHVEYLKTWMTNRFVWMEDQIKAW